MKKVFIKYNPYKLETEITVYGKKLAQNSKLREMSEEGIRLQEWIEELPCTLVEEYNDTDFDVIFNGTLLDFEDLTEVFTQAFESRQITSKLERIPAKETADKEILINKVFQEIQDGPFIELKDTDIINAFELAKSSDFEVCVVATMSAGKSTLINSMLGEQLMPSGQEACTAIITRIKDSDNSNWQAEVYDKAGDLIESHENITYESMDRLNKDDNVSTIKINGDIPFVSAGDVSLVLVDTPGPNNKRNEEHKKVQSEFLSKSSKSLVLYIMEGTFGSDDDDALLKRVSDSMSVGGKQSKDRFIFVVNKMDDRRKEDGDTEHTLNRIRLYLKEHGINNPNLFPVAALPALNIRLLKNNIAVDEDTLDETEMKVRKLNRNETLHLENYATLPTSVRSKIKSQLNNAIESDNAEDQALIHTGVVSVEGAIRQYIQKYAKTAKIKNIVDTFTHKLDEVGCFEETKRELAKNKDENDKIIEHIELIRKKIDDVKSAKHFKDTVDDAVVNVSEEAKEVIENIVQKFESRLTERIDTLKGEELSIDEAKYEVERLEKFARKLEPDFQVELEELIQQNLVKTSISLLNSYKNKLASLSDELNLNKFAGVQIDPLKLMSGSIDSINEFALNEFVKSKTVEDGEEWVSNTDKKWYKPWTWFQEAGYWRTKYKDIEYVDAGELAQTFFMPISDIIMENAERAEKHALHQSNKIAKRFNKEFKRLDDVLKSKLSELEDCATDKENAEKRIQESEDKLLWLHNIKQKVDSILEI